MPEMRQSGDRVIQHQTPKNMAAGTKKKGKLEFLEIDNCAFINDVAQICRFFDPPPPPTGHPPTPTPTSSVSLNVTYN